MSDSRVVVTSESLLAQLTQTAEPKPATTGEEKPAETPDPPPKEVEQQPKPKKPLIEELVRTRHERNEARTEAEQLRVELDELRQQMQTAQAMPAPKDPDPKPERSQFVSDEDYQEALTDWKVDQKLAERQQQEQQARMSAAQQQMQDNWTRRLNAAKADLQDFDEVVGKSEIDLPNHLYVALVESDTGPELAYYLAKNPDEAQRLKAMSPTAALRMLGKLEDRLAEEEAPAKDEKKESPKPETSKAPPPIEPLKDASTPVEKPTDKMTYQEYKAHRQAQRKR